MRRLLPKLVLIGAVTFAPGAGAAGPADPLLKLVPPDAGLTMAVEGLRDRAREVDAAAPVVGLRKLPAFRAWIASERFRKLERSARDVEAALGVSMGAIRDELLGDAFVLALRPGPADRPDQARGLLLARPRDRALLDRLIVRLDEVQKRAGELARLSRRSHGPIEYTAREFEQAGRPAEFHVTLADGTFAWSNSEEILRGVIDRKRSGGPGLGDNPAFARVRRGLPEGALASLYVDPRLVERSMAASPPKPGEERVAAMLGRYLGAVGYAGVALEYRDGFALHGHEAIDPARLDPWLRRWLAGPASPVDLAGRVPASAIAVVSARLDFEAIRDALGDLVAEADRPALANLDLAFRGLLLGRDPAREVLPRLGPGAIAYVEGGPRFPVVGVLDLADRPGAEGPASALDNALRTALALHALDPKRRPAHLRVETTAAGEARTTALTDGQRTRFACRIDRHRLVAGNDPGAVARTGSGPPAPALADLRARHFPGAETFAVVDLGRLAGEIRTYRGPIARHLASRSGRAVEAVDRDLGQILALADLFHAAMFTSVASGDASEVHRTLGLIAR